MWTTNLAIFFISLIVTVLSYAAVEGNSTWIEIEKVACRIGFVLGVAVGVGLSVIFTLTLQVIP